MPVVDFASKNFDMAEELPQAAAGEEGADGASMDRPIYSTLTIRSYFRKLGECYVPWRHNKIGISAMKIATASKMPKIDALRLDGGSPVSSIRSTSQTARGPTIIPTITDKRRTKMPTEPV